MFCGKTKEYLSQKQIPFEDRDITKDSSALADLEKSGYMTTPVTVIDNKAVVGFDIAKLDEALR